MEYFIQERIAGPTDYTKAYLKNNEMVRTAVVKGYDSAVARYEEIRDDFPLSEAFVDSRGRRLFKRGDYRGAIEVFRFNVFAFPNSSGAYESLGEAYMMSGDSENAIKRYRQALKIDPTSESALKGLEELGAGE